MKEGSMQRISWRSTARRGVRTLAVAALAATLALAGASGAEAATNAHLGLFSGDNGVCPTNRIGVAVSGFTDIPHPQGMNVVVELWGSDTFSDDFLERESPEVMNFPMPQGGTYLVQRCVLNSTLDEDWGEDEVYAKVFITDRATNQTIGLRTNEISHSF
jgi:hypothetical protein